MKKRIAVFASGSGSNLQALIDGCVSGYLSHTEIALVVGSKPGIGAFERAQKHGIPYVMLTKKDFASQVDFDIQLIETLETYQIDCLVLAGYLAILSEHMIARYHRRILNVHPSLIPAFCGHGYYGQRVHEAVIDSGVKLTGATVHFVDSGIDTGAILMQVACPVASDDTPQSIQKKVLKLEHQLLPQAVHALCRGRVAWQGNKAFTVDEVMEA